MTWTEFLMQKRYCFLCILKNSAIKFGSYVTITLLVDVTLSSKLYKQQKIIDSLLSKGWFNFSWVFAYDSVCTDATFTLCCIIMITCVFTSQG